MPQVNRYKNKGGIYIRAVQGGRISTYQVTEQGEQELRRAGFGSGGEISQGDLKYLRENGFAYTRGSGPGVLDSTPHTEVCPPPLNLDISVTHRALRESERRPRELSAWDRFSDPQPVPSGRSYEPPRRSPPWNTSPFQSASGPPRPVTRASGTTSSENEEWVLRLLGLGGITLMILLVFFILGELLFWLLLLFLPFGLMGGFLSNSKRRRLREGFFWGQFAGPVGFVIVAFLPEIEPANSLRESKPEREPAIGQASSDAGAVIGWFLVGLLLIILLFATVISVGR